MVVRVVIPMEPISGSKIIGSVRNHVHPTWLKSKHVMLIRDVRIVHMGRDVGHNHSIRCIQWMNLVHSRVRKQ